MDREVEKVVQVIQEVEKIVQVKVVEATPPTYIEKVIEKPVFRETLKEVEKVTPYYQEVLKEVQTRVTEAVVQNKEKIVEVPTVVEKIVVVNN